MIKRAWQALLSSRALAGAFLLAGLAALFLPAEVYDGNRTSMRLAFSPLLKYTLPAFGVLVAALVLPTLGKARRWKELYAHLLVSLALVSWVNATFLGGMQGSLDGMNFRLAGGTSALLLNSALYVAMLAAGYWANRRFEKPARMFLLLLAVLLAANVARVAFSTSVSSDVAASRDQLRSFSTRANVLLVLMDTFQADIFGDILEKDPAVGDRLQGFTFFPDTLGVAPTTRLTMPSIHSGRHFRPGDSLPSFYETGVAKGSFLVALAERGYQSYLITPMMGVCPAYSVCEPENSVVLGEGASELQQAAELADIALLRMVPYALKPAVYRNGDWLISSLWFLNAPRAEVSNGILDAIAGQLETDAAAPTVKWVHIFNTHPPARLDAQCGRLKRANWNRKNATAVSQCALIHLAGLLDSLRRNGIYDQTTVIVFGDHGASVPRTGGHVMGAQANPLLLVKPPQATGRVRTSQAPASLTDIPATVCALSKACDWPAGKNVLTLREGEVRDRIFVPYEFERDSWTAKPFTIEGRFQVSGHPAKLESWERIPDPATPPTRALNFNWKEPSNVFGPGWVRAVGPDRNTEIRWTSGSAALLWLLPPPGAKGEVTLSVTTHPGNPQQAMSIQADGVPMWRGDVPVNAMQEIRFQLPAPSLKRKQIRLHFQFSSFSHNAGLPRGKFEPLAVGFDKLELR